MAIHPNPQNYVKYIIARLNLGLKSYLLITCARYPTPNWTLIPPASSIKASNAGFHGVPLGAEDILKGNLHWKWAEIAEQQNRNPSQKQTVDEGIAQSRTIGSLGAVPATSSISTRVMITKTLTWRNSNLDHVNLMPPLSNKNSIY